MHINGIYLHAYYTDMAVLSLDCSRVKMDMNLKKCGLLWFVICG